MDLSIIIVSYKGWDRLRKCLESLSSFTQSQFSSEVIVVDNNSADGIIHEIEKSFPDFRFIYNKVNGGFANGCNLGAESAAGECLLFLNPDTVASENATGKLLLAARSNPGYFIVSCRQVNDQGKESHATGQFPNLWNLTGFQRTLVKSVKGRKKEHSDNEVAFPDWISGSVIMIEKEVFRKINGFDEDFWMYFEDVDICRRVHNIGGKIAFFRDIVIEHNHGGSSRINLKTSSITKTEVLISKHIYINKHKKGFNKFSIQLFLVLNNLISGLLMALPGTIFFFIPGINVKACIFTRLINYYFKAIFRLSWISPRSVNSGKTEQIR